MFHERTEHIVEPILLNTRQTARLLNISERTVFALVKNGDIPFVKIGRCLRFSMSDLEAFVERASKKRM
ncbi:helix-turn-helix domain-containing protein [Anaerobaca lacustris]|uniref:Helix-turn-helix domain-containing protein n=1 Tax=Anaerobaca lacustris TaxID=3044600 RepID=A0AAW6U1Z7_9BACT|nr:helix-turn-helix domain-containing protein [Sedimentisphaerales bacterium M17dextr]